MNPPFAKGQDVEHVLHAWEFLTPGGVIAAIVAPGFKFRREKHFEAFRDLHEQHGQCEIDVEAGAFKESGTNVATRIVVWRKPQAAAVTGRP